MIQPAATSAASARLDPVWQDFLEAFRLRRIWLRLSWMDLRLRYRRSYLGPLWLTVNAAIFILTVGTIFSLVLRGSKADYLPYFCSGYILWGFISHSISESCKAFTRSQQYILHMKLPHSLWILQLLARNLYVLLHMVPIYISVALFYQVDVGPSLLLVPLGAIAILANVAWISLFLAVVCLRYRDLTRLIQSVMHITFLATPIIWKADTLGPRAFIAQFNPMYHLIEVARAPLLGQWPSALSWSVVVGMAVVGWWLALLVYGRSRHRIAFWL